MHEVGTYCCSCQVVCTYSLCPLQFSLGNLDAKRDWGHAKDFVEVSLYNLLHIPSTHPSIFTHPSINFCPSAHPPIHQSHLHPPIHPSISTSNHCSLHCVLCSSCIISFYCWHCCLISLLWLPWFKPPNVPLLVATTLPPPPSTNLPTLYSKMPLTQVVWFFTHVCKQILQKWLLLYTCQHLKDSNIIEQFLWYN